METGSQNEPDMPFFRSELNWLFDVFKAIFMPFDWKRGFLYLKRG